MILVIASKLHDQFALSPLPKTFSVTAVRTYLQINFWFLFPSFVLKGGKQFFFISFFYPLIEVISVELWIYLLYFFQSDGKSLTQRVFPFSNTGFLKKFPKVLITCPAIEGASSVVFEWWCIFTSWEISRKKLWKSAPRSPSILLGLRFDAIRTLENSIVFVREFLFFNGIAHVDFGSLSIILKTYLNTLFFDVV